MTYLSIRRPRRQHAAVPEQTMPRLHPVPDGDRESSVMAGKDTTFPAHVDQALKLVRPRPLTCRCGVPAVIVCDVGGWPVYSCADHAPRGCGA